MTSLLDGNLQNELEVLKNGLDDEKLIKACNFISDYFQTATKYTTCNNLSFRNQKQQNIYVSLVVKYLLITAVHSSSTVRIVAEEKLQRIIKLLINSHPEKILVVLVKSMGQPKTAIPALDSFSFVCHHVHPKKARVLLEFILIPFQIMFEKGTSDNLEIMAKRLPMILEVLGKHLTKDDVGKFVERLILQLSSQNVPLRRNSAKCLAHLFNYTNFVYFDDLMTSFGKIIDVSMESKDGCFQAISSILQVLKSFDGSTIHFANFILDLLYKNVTNTKIATIIFTCLTHLFNLNLKLDVKLISTIGDELVNYIKEGTSVMIMNEALEILSNYVYHFAAEKFIKREDDLLNLLKKEDYTIRGKTAILIGAILGTNQNQQDLKLEVLKSELKKMFRRETNSLCLKMIVQSFEYFLPNHITSETPSELIEILDKKDSFWGVKSQILSLFTHFNFAQLDFYQSGNSKLVFERILEFLGDEDARVRQQASNTLLEILPVLVLSHEPDIILFQRLIIDNKRDNITDREIVNLYTIFSEIFAKIKLAEKNTIDGICKFLIAVGEKYPQSYLVDFANDVIDEMTDLLKFKEFSADINIHLQIIQVIKLYFIEERTKYTLDYLIFVLNLLEDFVNPNVDIFKHANWDLIFTRKNYEKHASILNTSFKSSASKFNLEDKMESFVIKLLETLTRVIQVGDLNLIVKESFTIIKTVEKHSDHTNHTLICLQELFIRIFGTEEKIPDVKKAIDYENVDIYDILNLRKKFLKPSLKDRKHSFFLSDRLSDVSFIKLVEEFEIIFFREIKAISDTHFEQTQTIILKLISKLILIGQYNKDKGFLQRLLILIKEQGIYLIDHNMNHGMIDLISTLKYVIQYNPIDLLDDKILDVIGRILAKNPDFIAELTPMLISSWTVKNGLGEELFSLFLQNIKARGAMRGVTDLLYSIRSNNEVVRRLTHQILLQFFTRPHLDSLVTFLEVAEIAEDKLQDFELIIDDSMILTLVMMKMHNKHSLMNEQLLKKALKHVIEPQNQEIVSHLIDECIISLGIGSPTDLSETFEDLFHFSTKNVENSTIYIHTMELCVLFAIKNVKFGQHLLTWLFNTLPDQNKTHRKYVLSFSSYFFILHLLVKNEGLKIDNLETPFWTLVIQYAFMTETTDFIRICAHRIPIEGFLEMIQNSLTDQNVAAICHIVRFFGKNENLLKTLEKASTKLKFRKRVLLDLLPNLEIEKKISSNDSTLGKVCSQYLTKEHQFKHGVAFLCSSSIDILAEILLSPNIDLKIIVEAIPRMADLSKLIVIKDYILKRSINTFEEVIEISKCVYELVKTISLQKVEMLHFYDLLMTMMVKNTLTAHDLKSILHFNEVMSHYNHKQVHDKICQFFLEIMNVPYSEKDDCLSMVLNQVASPLKFGHKYPNLEQHRKTIQKIIFGVAKHYSEQVYSQFIEDHFDVVHIQKIIYLLENIPMSSDMFVKIWNPYFDAFKSMSEVGSDSLQISSLKLVTKMICMIRIKETKGHLNVVVLDPIFGRAIFNGFLKFLDHTIRHSHNFNVEFTKEMVRSIVFILTNNPDMMESHLHGDGDLMIISPRQSHVMTFDMVENLMMNLLKDEPDRLLVQYLLMGMARCYTFTKNVSMEKTLILWITKGLETKHLAEASCYAITELMDQKAILTNLILGITGFVSKRLLKQVTTKSLINFVNMVTEIILRYPEASIHNFTSKCLPSLMLLIADTNTPYSGVSMIYNNLQKLLLNYSLSINERSQIYQLTNLVGKKSETSSKSNTPSSPIVNKNISLKGAERISSFKSPEKSSGTSLQRTGSFKASPVLSPIKKELSGEPKFTLEGPIMDGQVIRQNRYSLFLGLVMASFYSQSVNKIEHEKIQFNVLHLYHQFKGVTTHREEFFCKILPPLLEDFVEIDQILPLVLPSFLKMNTHDELIHLVFNNFMKKKYKADDYEDWVRYALDTIEMKISVNRDGSMKVLGSLFVACLKSQKEYCDFCNFDKEDVFACILDDFTKYLQAKKFEKALKSLENCIKSLKLSMNE